jgi:hypothetical protein
MRDIDVNKNDPITQFVGFVTEALAMVVLVAFVVIALMFVGLYHPKAPTQEVQGLQDMLVPERNPLR